MLNDPNAVMRYRNRAEELRTIAESAKDAQVRADLEKWAREYDLMAMCSVDLKQSGERSQISE